MNDVINSGESIGANCKKVINPGDVFGDWTVINEVKMAEKRKHYLVQCKCGFQRILKGIRLRFGDSLKCRTCGSSKHKMSRSLTYAVWECIMQRTTNPNHTKFEYYGGRGITICEEWKDFKNFYADMGDRPKGFEIDRIDNNKGYSKDNCRWTTHSENLKNRRASNLKNYKPKHDQLKITDFEQAG